MDAEHRAMMGRPGSDGLYVFNRGERRAKENLFSVQDDVII